MKRQPFLIAIILSLTVLLAVLVAMVVLTQEEAPAPTLSSTPSGSVQSTSPSSEATDPPTEPTEPPITKIATATVSSVGDILMHKPVFDSGYDSTTDTYDLNLIFRYISDYISGADMALANLETTLAGSDNGYEYKGYPNFNCPDAIVDALKNAGFDNILTANNHTYDTGHLGYIRTQEILQDRGLMWMGTKMDAEQDDYLIAELNGIRIGMLCYTYATPDGSDELVTLNYGATMSAADSQLINAFDYDRLPAFYAEIQDNLAQMEAEGAEAVMLFIHWGDEYDLTGNSIQKEMAQKLCDLGIDVIVGGHPHVVEPMELLTSTLDEAQKTVCLYSMGNAVSNQRLGNISYVHTAHTEDGVMFSVTFAKYSDGTVLVESTEAMPIWVDMRRNAQWVREYYILPLDMQIEDWQSQFALTDEALQNAKASYQRTIAIVGQGMAQANDYFRANQAAVEAALGVPS